MKFKATIMVVLSSDFTTSLALTLFLYSVIAEVTSTDSTTRSTRPTSMTAGLSVTAYPSQNPAPLFSIIHLVCSAFHTGNGSVFLSWRYNSCYPSRSYRQWGNSGNNFNLLLPVRLYDYGQYTCEARDWLGTVVRTTFWLNIGPPQPDTAIHPHYSTQLLYKTYHFYLECSVFPKGNGRIVPQMHTDRCYPSTLWMWAEYNSAQFNDSLDVIPNNFENYTCEVRNWLGTMVSTDHGGYAEPWLEITAYPSQNPAQPYSYIHLVCLAYLRGGRGLSATWLHNNRPFISTKADYSTIWWNHSIYVYPYSYGEYKCKVQNWLGSVLSMRFWLNVGQTSTQFTTSTARKISAHAPRNITLLNAKMDSFEYKLGDVLHCSADGNPGVRIQWRNNIRFNVTYPEGPTLTLTKAMLGYNSFRCVATNTVAGQRNSRYKDFNITVVQGHQAASGSTVPAFVYIVVSAVVVLVLLSALSVLVIGRRRQFAAGESPPLGDVQLQEGGETAAGIKLSDSCRPPSEHVCGKSLLPDEKDTSKEQLQPIGGWDGSISKVKIGV